MHQKQSNNACVNSNVKVIRKKKDQKFIGSATDQNLKGASGPKKSQGMWISPREINFTGKYKPIWQTWGSRQANPKGQLGFISNQDVFGNHKKGKQWVEEQKKRQQEDVFEPGQIPEIPEDNIEEEQIIYIQPSVAEARLKRLREMGRSFTDQDFPPNDYSLCGPYGPIPDWETIKWRRTSFAIQKPVLINKKIEPNDIKQGFLGDCYFLAGLAAIAERPDRIFNLFLLKQLNDMNYFSVKMLYRGKWRTVDIDDYVPFVFNAPAFGKSNNGELWVIVLEKAWAKIYGSFKQIEAGFPEEPLHDLTGAPIKHIFLNTKGQKYEEQWNYLLLASKKEWAMVASSKPGSDTDQSNSGIYQGHAYTFLNATILKVGGQQIKLVQLRNPWGKGEYKGRWSDNDPAWNTVSEEEKRRIYRGTAADDGIFFMEYDVFVYEFRNITIAEINDNASYVYESFYDPEIKGAYFTINVIKPCEYSFQIDKTPERSYTGEKQRRYQYPQAWLEIARIDGSNVQRFQGYISKRRTLFKSYELQPGKYVAWVRIQFDPNFEEDYEVNLAVYSDYVCGIKLATREEAIKFQDGDQGVQWTGERIKKPSQIRGPQPGIPSGPSFDEKGKGTLFNFLNRDRNANKQGISHLSPNSKITPSTVPGGSLGIISPTSAMKRKKIRTIEVHHTKVQITQENQHGEGIVTVEQKEVRKETLKTMQQDGGENIKSKEQQKRVDSKELTYQGETINKKQKLSETLKIRQTKPNGETMEKVETQEHQIETMEVDDESNGSILSQQRKELPQQPSQNIERTSSFTNPEERKLNTIKTHLEKEKKHHDQLRYQEPDSESNGSYVQRR